VYERALQLAGESRDDQAAVSELKALAAGKRRTLRRAERAMRSGGRAREDRKAHLAQRLLEAAGNDQSVAQISAEDERRLELLEEFARQSRAEQWSRLVAGQPALAGLESEARAGAFGNLPEGRVSESVPTERERQERAEQARLRLALMNRLWAVLGPAASSHDPLLTSEAAVNVALQHLLRLSDASAEDSS
jgi:hypothetical protein